MMGETNHKYAIDQPSIVAVTDEKGIITYVNDHFCEISKYTAEELIGQDHRILNSRYHSKELFAELWATINNGSVWKGELRNKAKDGTLYWADTTIVPFLNKDQKPYQFATIQTVISGRKKGQVALKETFEELSHYKYALDQSAIVAITNKSGIITYVNEKFCTTSKYSSEELIGQDHRIINSGYYSKVFFKKLWSTILSGNVWKGELRNKAKDGSLYWVDTTIIPFLDKKNQPYQFVAIRFDITKRKKVEAQIKLSNKKAIQYTQVLESKNAQLVDFCSIISHNLRAPLTSILMLVDYLEQTKNKSERNEVLVKIKPVVNHLLDVFNDLVEAIQIQYDTNLVLEKIDLNDCLKKVLVGFDAQIQDCRADVQIDFTQAPVITSHQKYIHSIFTNLISNTLKYKSPNRKLIIIIRSFLKGKNKVVLSVSDNGLGIDLVLHKEQIFKIRKTFHKHPEAKGLGLFMTKTQVDALGGKIWAESQPNKGSIFFIELKHINT